MSEPTPKLLKSIQAEKHTRARQMSPLERLLAGPALYDAFINHHRIGLRHQHPSASEKQIEKMLFDRVEVLQKERSDEHA